MRANKVNQKFCNRYISVVLNAFAEVVKVTNHTEL